MTPKGTAEHITIVCSCMVEDRGLNVACSRCIESAIREAVHEAYEDALEIICPHIGDASDAAWFRAVEKVRARMEEVCK